MEYTINDILGKSCKAKANEANTFHLIDESPVSWYGDNGVIDNCIFSKNRATNGGAIDWKGYNGVIVNTWFLDNYARDLEVQFILKVKI